MLLQPIQAQPVRITPGTKRLVGKMIINVGEIYPVIQAFNFFVKKKILYQRANGISLPRAPIQLASAYEVL